MFLDSYWPYSRRCWVVTFIRFHILNILYRITYLHHLLFRVPRDCPRTVVTLTLYPFTFTIIPYAPHITLYFYIFPVHRFGLPLLYLFFFLRRSHNRLLYLPLRFLRRTNRAMFRFLFAMISSLCRARLAALRTCRTRVIYRLSLIRHVSGPLVRPRDDVRRRCRSQTVRGARLRVHDGLQLGGRRRGRVPPPITTHRQWRFRVATGGRAPPVVRRGPLAASHRVRPSRRAAAAPRLSFLMTVGVRLQRWPAVTVKSCKKKKKINAQTKFSKRHTHTHTHHAPTHSLTHSLTRV